MRCKVGRMTATRSVCAAMTGHASFMAFFADSFDRHRASDFGDVSVSDRQANYKAIRGGTRVVSAYTIPDCLRDEAHLFDKKLLFITEADRSYTTGMFLGEY